MFVYIFVVLVNAMFIIPMGAIAAASGFVYGIVVSVLLGRRYGQTHGGIGLIITSGSTVLFLGNHHHLWLIPIPALVFIFGAFTIVRSLQDAKQTDLYN